MPFTAYRVSNQQPPGGCSSRIIRYSPATQATGSARIDLTQAVQAGVIDQIQSAFIDAGNCTSPVIVTSESTGYRVTMAAGMQGWVPVLATNAPRFTVACADTVNAPELAFGNMPMPIGAWSA